MKDKINRTLKNTNKFKNDKFNKEHVLFDENNTIQKFFLKV